MTSGLIALLCKLLTAPKSYDISENLFKAEEFIGYFTIAFFLASLIAGACMVLLAQIWPAPYVPVVTKLPDPLEKRSDDHWIFGDYLGSKFRFRLAGESDLQTFANYSAGEPAIENANPALDRLALYRRWFARNHDTFMFMEVRGPSDPIWRIGAISIVLPLNKTGFDSLWAGVTEVKDLGDSHISKKGTRPAAILLDTLIAQPIYKNKFATMVFSLTVAHASRFWVPTGKQKIEYVIEPDHKRFPSLLPEMGFEGPHVIQRDHKLYRFSYPLKKSQLTERQKETSALLVENLRAAAKWPIAA